MFIADALALTGFCLAGFAIIYRIVFKTCACCGRDHGFWLMTHVIDRNYGNNVYFTPKCVCLVCPGCLTADILMHNRIDDRRFDH